MSKDFETQISESEELFWKIHSIHNSIDPEYTENEDITSRMRKVLLDWMWEMSSELGFKRQTYYLAVNYTDRFLSIVTNV